MSVAPIFFGWKVVGVAFLIAVFAWGLGFYGLSVFLHTLHATRGWAISTISAAITLHFIFSAVIVANLPQLHRHFGLARVTGTGITLSAFGIVAWASASEPWQLFPAALLTSGGWAVTNGATINAIVAPWFERDRAKALSIAFNGASFGGVVFAPLLVALISWLGPPGAALVVAGAMLAILLPLTRRYLRRGPESAGPAREPTRTAMTRIALVRDRRFVTLTAAFALALFAQIGVVAHLVARLAPVLGPSRAAFAVSTTAICAMVGRTLLGWRLGDADRRLAAAVNFALQAVGVLLLSFGGGDVALALGCILFGLGVGNVISLPPLIVQAEFDSADVPGAVALASAINQAILAFAPIVFGLLHDAAASYVLPFVLGGCAQLAAAVILVRGGAFPAGRPPRATDRDDRSACPDRELD